MSEEKKKKKQQTDMTTVKRVLRFSISEYKKTKWDFIWLTLSRLFAVILGLIPAIYYKEIVDLLSSALDIGSAVAANALAILLYVFRLKLIGVLFQRIFDYFLIKVEMNQQRSLYLDAFTYIQQHSLQFFSDNFTGALIKKVTKFTGSFEGLTDMLFFEIMAFLVNIVVILVVMGFEDIRFSVVFFLGMAIFIVVQYKMYQWIYPYQEKANSLDSELGGVLADAITNNYNIKIFASQKRETRAFENIATKATNARKTQYYKSMRIWGFTGVFVVSLEVGILSMVIYFWGQGIVSVGVFVLLQTYLLRVMEQMWGIGHVFRRFFRCVSEIGETLEILDKPHSVVDLSDKKLKVKHGEVQFDDVTFAYNEGTNVFDHLTFRIKPGERVALVGQSGGGKTTVGKLLFRFFDIQGGKILVDDQDISQVTQDSLRAQIGMVPQDPILFHRSIKENIAYGRPSATIEEIVAAAKMARCHEFIGQLPQQYDTLVGERGIKLSGGERQRVAIARAILENAPILLLDEATSALDSESEHMIQEAMEELMRNKTVIVIAHRLSTIMKMDNIIVMEGGEIMEKGSHGELIAQRGIYAKLWDIQSGGFIGE